MSAEAIVASGSMVTHDVPPNMVVAGSPAKVIRERKSEGGDMGMNWIISGYIKKTIII